jgi:hypothetical protein
LNRQEVLRMTRKPDGSVFQVSDDPFDQRVYQFPSTIRKLETARALRTDSIVR